MRSVTTLSGLLLLAVCSGARADGLLIGTQGGPTGTGQVYYLTCYGQLLHLPVYLGLGLFV